MVFKSGQSAVSTNSKSCILVHIIDDMIVETIESFFLEILSSDIVHVSPSSTIATVTILDDFSDGKSTVLLHYCLSLLSV